MQINSYRVLTLSRKARGLLVFFVLLYLKLSARNIRLCLPLEPTQRRAHTVAGARQAIDYPEQKQQHQCTVMPSIIQFLCIFYDSGVTAGQVSRVISSFVSPAQHHHHQQCHSLSIMQLATFSISWLPALHCRYTQLHSLFFFLPSYSFPVNRSVGNLQCVHFTWKPLFLPTLAPVCTSSRFLPVANHHQPAPDMNMASWWSLSLSLPLLSALNFAPIADFCSPLLLSLPLFQITLTQTTAEWGRFCQTYANLNMQ